MDKDYETTVAGTPIKQKVFLKSDLSSFEANNCYNMELQFEDNEVGKGNYLYVLSHVEGSKNNASVFVSNSWTNKTLPEEYEQYNLVTYINGKKATNEVAYSSFVVKTEVEKVDKGTIPTDKIDDNVAKVILLGGQSNAVGVSLNSELQKNVSAEKFAEYTNGYSNVQIVYNNCSGNFSYKFVNTKIGQAVNTDYFGPELGIAEYLSEHFPNEKFYIIKYAMGGSVLETQWYNAKAGTPLELLCGLENFAKQGLAALEDQGLEPQIIGFVWNQGESDSITLPQASRYYANQAGLVDYVRTIFADYACARGIGFFDAGIVSNLWPAYAYTNIQKYDYSLTSPINFYIETTDYPDINTLKENNDMAHYDSLAMIKLGHLYGAEIEKFLK